MGDRNVRLVQRTGYPWDGDISFEVEGEGEFALMLRIPSWCEDGASIEVNGEPFTGQAAPGSYAEVRRVWQPGDFVRLHLPMPVRHVEAHPYVAEDAGRVALMRGPMLYCVEGADNPGIDLRDLVLPDDREITPDFLPDLLGGVVSLGADVEIASPDDGWENQLYRVARERQENPGTAPTRIRAIPYHAWANRTPGPMRVWLKRG